MLQPAELGTLWRSLPQGERDVYGTRSAFEREWSRLGPDEQTRLIGRASHGTRREE